MAFYNVQFSTLESKWIMNKWIFCLRKCIAFQSNSLDEMGSACLAKKTRERERVSGWMQELKKKKRYCVCVTFNLPINFETIVYIVYHQFDLMVVYAYVCIYFSLFFHPFFAFYFYFYTFPCIKYSILRSIYSVYSLSLNLYLQSIWLLRNPPMRVFFSLSFCVYVCSTSSSFLFESHR